MVHVVFDNLKCLYRFFRQRIQASIITVDMDKDRSSMGTRCRRKILMHIMEATLVDMAVTSRHHRRDSNRHSNHLNSSNKLGSATNCENISWVNSTCLLFCILCYERVPKQFISLRLCIFLSVYVSFFCLWLMPMKWRIRLLITFRPLFNNNFFVVLKEKDINVVMR